MLIRLYLIKEELMMNLRAQALATALGAGFRKHGHTVVTTKGTSFEGPVAADLVVFIGFSRERRKIMDAYHAQGVRVLIVDKAFIRAHNRSNHNRICMDGISPLRYLMREQRDGRRWRQLYQPLWPERGEARNPDLFYTYANNSQVVHEFAHLGDAHELAVQTLKRMGRMLEEGGHMESPKLLYRPKRTLPEAEKAGRYKMSVHPDTIEDCLANTQALVTYTSSCAVNAIMHGIPAFCLGPCAATPMANVLLDDLPEPWFPTDTQRLHWLENLAWCQWTDEEISKGQMFDFISSELHATDSAFQEYGGSGV